MKLIFGQMGIELLLSSHNIVPTKLLNSDFEFKYMKIGKAIDDLIIKDNRRVDLMKELSCKYNKTGCF